MEWVARKSAELLLLMEDKSLSCKILWRSRHSNS